MHPLILLATAPLVLPGAPATDTPVHGTYVEARTASVFAGACHYAGEFTTQGRDALLGWHLTEGTWGGVGLAGVEIAVALAGNDNLAAEAVQRTSVIYVDGDATPAERSASLAWLRARHGDLLGKVLAVRTAPVRVTTAEDSFHLAVGDSSLLTGSALPNRACCAMPFNVWYEPLEQLADGRLVGCVDVFRHAELGLEQRWKRHDENSAFFGSF